jgi:hypothetical protein
MKLNFGSLTLDLVRLSLFGPAGEVRLRPKSFEVLRYLAERAGQAVTKDELIAVAATYGQTGMASEARLQIEQVLRIEPDCSFKKLSPQRVCFLPRTAFRDSRAYAKRAFPKDRTAARFAG